MPIDPVPPHSLRKSDLRSFARDESGVAAIVIALGLTMMLGFVALAIDVGMLYRERAQLQADADIAALGVVPDFTQAQDRVDFGLSQNGQDPSVVQNLQLGRFLRNPAIAKDQRFTPLPEGSPRINAVVLTLAKASPLYFAQTFVDAETAWLSVSATALRTGAASFSLASHVLLLDETSLSDALSQSLNAQVRISAGELHILTDTTFSAGDFLNAMIAQTGFDGLNPADILDQTVSASEVIAALQTAAPSGLPDSVTSLASVTGGPAFTLRDVMSGSDTSLGLTTVDFLSGSLLSARDILAALATQGARGAPVAVDVTASVPGVTATETHLSLGEPPAQSGVIAVGEVGVTLHSRAARLHTDTSLSPDLLGALGAGVQATQLNLPLYTELAGTTATLTALGCTGDEASALAAEFATAQSELHPSSGASVAALYLGELPAGTMTTTGAIDPADLGFADVLEIAITIDLPLLPDLVVSNIVLQARAHVALGQSRTETITFTKGDIAAGDTTRTFGSGDLLATGVQSLLSPGNLEVRLKPGQSGLETPAVANVLAGVLDALPAALFAGLVAPVDGVMHAALDTTGVQLGVGELTLRNHLCEVPKLVR